ncbi:hypothetical protein [Olsenella sp. HMSC062G07]|uniref:hypothetical protein n=1 Tax=Olsenella sp. HMSC062G07 TaxID=1739330 RepID=UPI001AEFB499|nr:hypothetical protein [Olsenella sp. HMSC062G07]
MLDPEGRPVTDADGKRVRDVVKVMPQEIKDALSASRRAWAEEHGDDPRAVMVGVALAALLVIAGGFLLFKALIGQPPTSVGEGSDAAQPEQQQTAAVSVDMQTGAVDSGSIDYLDETFSMVNIEGSAAVVATDKAGNQRTLFKLSGVPTGLLLYNGIILVPENLDDGWDVISYVVDGESQAGPIMVDGAPVHGDAEIDDAYLDGSELVVVDAAGSTTRIAL